MYDSKTYWNNRPNPNKGTKPENIDARHIPPFLVGARSVVEFGPGVGRMYQFYKGLNVTGIDFAKQYEDAATQSAIAAGVSMYTHRIHDVHEKPTPYKDNQFEKGLLIKVLLHAPHFEAVRILKEVGRIAEEVLVITYGGTQDGLAQHCFVHDYEELLEDVGATVHEFKTEGNQVVFKYSIK